MPKYIVTGFAILAVFASFGAKAQRIQVFTDQQHPVHAVPEQARVFELDQSQQIEEQITSGLNADQAYSADLVKTRLNAQTHRQLTDTYQGVVDAWTLGVQKIPAVVVDRKYVIYGEPDVSRAVSRIQMYRERQP